MINLDNCDLECYVGKVENSDCNISNLINLTLSQDQFHDKISKAKIDIG